MMRTKITAMTAMAAWAAIAAVATAQDQPESTKPAPAAESQAVSPETATVQRIMERATLNIAKRYNLNEEQTGKTQEIMSREVMRFLTEHENEVWPIIRQLLTAQSLGKPPDDADLVKRIGEQAGPLLAQIKEAIYRGNEEWRMYLSPEQKVMHDYDLGEMEKTFQSIGDSLDKWAQGAPPEESIFPPPPRPELDPPRPPKPTGLPENPVIEIFEPRRLFDAYVEDFIRRYDLDEGQIDTARSILAEFKGKAVDFRQGNKSGFEKLGLALRMAQEKGDRRALLAAEAARKELLAPVHKLFDEMADRMTALLTTTQRELHDAKEAGPRTARKSSETRKTPAKEPSGGEVDPSSDRQRDD